MKSGYENGIRDVDTENIESSFHTRLSYTFKCLYAIKYNINNGGATASNDNCYQKLNFDILVHFVVAQLRSFIKS